MAPSNGGRRAPSCGDLRMVLLGAPGSGRTTTANAILGTDAFLEHITMESSMETRDIGGRDVSLIDTPTSLMVDRGDLGSSREELDRCLALSAPGPHAFLLVVPLLHGKPQTESNPESTRLFTISTGIDWILRNLGQSSLRATVLLFTGREKLTRRSWEHFLSGQEVRGLIGRCGGGYHALNSKAEVQCVQISELLDKVEGLVEESGGLIYRSDKFLQQGSKMEIRIGAQQKDVVRQKNNTTSMDVRLMGRHDKDGSMDISAFRDRDEMTSTEARQQGEEERRGDVERRRRRREKEDGTSWKDRAVREEVTSTEGEVERKEDVDKWGDLRRQMEMRKQQREDEKKRRQEEEEERRKREEEERRSEELLEVRQRQERQAREETQRVERERRRLEEERRKQEEEKKRQEEERARLADEERRQQEMRERLEEQHKQQEEVSRKLQEEQRRQEEEVKRLIEERKRMEVEELREENRQLRRQVEMGKGMEVERGRAEGGGWNLERMAGMAGAFLAPFIRR